MNLVRTVVWYTVPGFVWRPGFLRPQTPQGSGTSQQATSNGRLGLVDEKRRIGYGGAGAEPMEVDEDEEKALVLRSRLSSEDEEHFELTPRARMDLIARLESTPTLLPQNLASFITAASLAARVSLRSSAFLIELIFEASRYGTSAGLGITRRALISAVSSASVLQQSLGDAGEESDKTFLTLLDRYTAVGCYVIHSAFTMAELFAIAGLQLTQSAFSTGFGVRVPPLEAVSR